jgi:hypothetical protein
MDKKIKICKQLMIYQYILNYNIEIINKLFQQIRLSDEILFQNHNLIHAPYIYIRINYYLIDEPRFLEKFCLQKYLQMFAAESRGPSI